ncbi:MAG: hypothetical protein QOJ59_2823 [Thermomicrobiales bacterium]|jgi:hypothetical protein|nr:hypothetical protein [Thermomicrobiales bacterium]MEA2528053.1 hypothetical protein [Thermomicrobiales bacterium]
MSIKRGTPPLELFLQDVVRLRKPHPCGSFEWTIVRLGADIGLRCHGCNRKVLLPRRELEKRLKTFVSRGPDHALAAAAATGADASPEVAPEAVLCAGAAEQTSL